MWKWVKATAKEAWDYQAPPDPAAVLTDTYWSCGHWSISGVTSINGVRKCADCYRKGL